LGAGPAQPVANREAASMAISQAAREIWIMSGVLLRMIY
jgi:hypothetical protein